VNVTEIMDKLMAFYNAGDAGKEVVYYYDSAPRGPIDHVVLNVSEGVIVLCDEDDFKRMMEGNKDT